MLLLATAGLVALHQLREWAVRGDVRSAMFERAKQRAEATGRQLVVIGDPEGGVTNGEIPYGDVCIDLTGCPNAPSHVQAVQADLSEGTDLPSDKYVVFVCYVLELVPDIERAWAEVMRLAGSFENVFVLALHPTREVQTHLYPGVRWHIHNAPPEGPFLYEPAHMERMFKRSL